MLKKDEKKTLSKCGKYFVFKECRSGFSKWNRQTVQAPILQLPVFLNKNTESRQFGTFEQLFEKYMFKIDFES